MGLGRSFDFRLIIMGIKYRGGYGVNASEQRERGSADATARITSNIVHGETFMVLKFGLANRHPPPTSSTYDLHIMKIGSMQIHSLAIARLCRW